MVHPISGRRDAPVSCRPSIRAPRRAAMRAASSCVAERTARRSILLSRQARSREWPSTPSIRRDCRSAVRRRRRSITSATRYFSSSMRQTSRQDDGQLVFSDVPPGDYHLIVSTSHRQEEAAYVNVKVDGDVTLKVQTNSGARVSGRFVVQGPPRDARSRTVPSGGRGQSAAGQVWPVLCERRSGSPATQRTDFELTGLTRSDGAPRDHVAGHCWCRSAAREERTSPADHSISRARRSSTTCWSSSRPRRAEVEVTLTGLREPEDPETVLVTLFSEDPARWHAGFGSVQYTAIQATTEMPLLASSRGRHRSSPWAGLHFPASGQWCPAVTSSRPCQIPKS